MNDFELLYKDNYKKILYYLVNLSNNHELAEELTQETFYKVLQFIIVHKNIHISTAWLLKIAHNLFIDYIRKNRLKITDFDYNNEFLIVGDISIEEQLDIKNLLNLLPIRYKTILLLKDYYGLSYTEISRVLSCSLSTVKVTLYRARQKFKEVYAKYEHGSSK